MITSDRTVSGGYGWPSGVDGVLPEEPLARHSQFGVGGPAQWFVKVRDAGLLAELLRRCSETRVPVTLLGAGSNALIPDAGVRGLVLRYDDRQLRVIDDRTAELGGGCMMPRAALDCARRGLAGLEFGIGVPGTCGASVFGNAGAFGTEMSDVVLSCDVLSPAGAMRTLSHDELGFRYRHSALKESLPGHVVISARFRVHRDDPAAVRARTDAIQAQRKATQPYGVRSLGSVFKNPPGDTAGRLIEAAELKGRRSGGAQISPKHANFIVNVDRATAADVLALVRLAHDEILQRFGVDLEREIIVLGESESVGGGAAGGSPEPVSSVGPVTAGTPPRRRSGLPTASAPWSPRSRGAPPAAPAGLPPAAPPPLDPPATAGGSVPI